MAAGGGLGLSIAAETLRRHGGRVEVESAGDDGMVVVVRLPRDANKRDDSARSAPEVLKAIVRANQNNAGVYGAVTRTGRLAVGQTIFLHAATELNESR